VLENGDFFNTFSHCIFGSLKKYVLWNEVSVPLPIYICYVYSSLGLILQPLLLPNKASSIKLSPFGTRYIIGHMHDGLIHNVWLLARDTRSAKRGIAIVSRLSVCLSVTLRYREHISWTKFISKLITRITLRVLAATKTTLMIGLLQCSRFQKKMLMMTHFKLVQTI